MRRRYIKSSLPRRKYKVTYILKSANPPGEEKIFDTLEDATVFRNNLVETGKYIVSKVEPTIHVGVANSEEE